MIDRVVEGAARNRLLVFLGTLFALGGIVWSIQHTPLDAIPDLSETQVIVFSEWPGRSPTLVEDQITYPITASLLAAPGVSEVRGYSMLGMSFVHVVFAEGTDVYWARSRVLEALSTLSSRLPVTPSLGPDATGIGWVFQYALVDRSGKHDLAALRTFQDFTLRYALASVPGVAEVASVGGYQKQFQVVVDPAKLVQRGLGLGDVVSAVRGASQEIGGRVVEMAEREYVVRGRAYAQGLADLEALPLPGGARVADVATVRFGPDLRRGLFEWNGEGEAVGGIVVARYGANALGTIEAVKARITELRSSFPEGVELEVAYDRSDLIHRSIDTLRRALIEEAIAVSLIVLLFLLHLPSALVPILSLPLAVGMAFIPMALFDVPSTIMSLGGIAIAIGATVDAEIVMVEACHKKLEEHPGATGETRRHLLAEAAREVTPAIFFSLLVIAVSFLPVFTLTGQAGRLFRPLALTKTFVMIGSALLAVTFAPALRDAALRGRIRPESRHPISRAIIALYRPFVYVALRRPRSTVAIGLLAVLSAIPLASRLGTELMPPLDEGDLLYMPTTLPNLSIEAAKRQLQRQDRILRSFPEVVSVAGKIGRADSATDPAPLSMVETTVRLKPRREWRQIDGRPMTLAELTREMDEKLRLPGWTNAWTYPVKTRVDMMATGIRTPVGIKVFGRSLADIDRVGQALEPLLRGISGTRSVFYERTLGGLYVDVIPRRDDLVRHGVGLGELLELVEIGVGGAPVATTLDGRARLSISVRFPQDLRADRDALAAMLVPLGEGRALPLSQLADVVVAHGPAMVRDEDGHLCAYVYVDIDEEARDLGAWVAEARALVEKGLMRPAGTFLQWSGQVEELDALSARLKLVVPLTLLIVLLLLVLHFKNLVEAVIVLLSVPFALVGSVWMLWLLDYRLSTAVWVGMIALVGLAAQTGIVMIVYIDHAYEKRRRAGKIRTLDDVIWAHLEGTVLRVRPKLMTVAAMLAGLVPLLWAEGSGADVMKRIAAPMVGGLLSSAFLTLEIIPVLYTYWRGEQLLHERVPPERRRRLRAAAIACGWSLVAVLVAAALPFYVDLGRLWPLVVTGAALALSIAAYLRARVGYRSAP